MSTRNFRSAVFALAAGLIVTFALAPSAFADRRSSLAGNLLIEDADDVWLYPHTLTKYARMISFDLAVNGAGGPSTNALPQAGNATSGFGSAMLVMGSENGAFAIATHRQDFWGGVVPAYYLMGDLDQHFGVAGLNTIGAPGPLFPAGGIGGQGFLPPLQWIDLMGAFELGGAPFGARLSIGHHQNNTTIDNDGTELINNVTANSVDVSLGTVLKQGDTNIDLGLDLGLGLQSFENDDSNNLSTIDATGLNLALTGRAFVPMARGVDLGIVGLAYYRSLSAERVFDNDSNGDFESAFYSAGLDVGAGPRYMIEDRFIISGYATMGLRIEDDEPNTNFDFDEEHRTLIGIPMLKLSGEYFLFDWLKLRTGAHYAYSFVFTERETNTDVIQNDSINANSFRWVAGAGVEWEGLELNGTFQQDFLLNGPAFIGGDTGGMFAYLNVNYAF